MFRLSTVYTISEKNRNQIKKGLESATEDEIEKLSWAHRQRRVIWTPLLQAC